MNRTLHNTLLIFAGLTAVLGAILLTDLTVTKVFYPNGRGLSEGQAPAWIAGAIVAATYHLHVWRRFRR